MKEKLDNLLKFLYGYFFLPQLKNNPFMNLFLQSQ